MSKHRLVFGLGAGFCYSSTPGHIPGATYEGWLPKVLDNITGSGHDVLISTVDMPVRMAQLIYKIVGGDHLYLDSGGFTLFKDEMKWRDGRITKEEFEGKCEKMKKKFIGLLKTIHPKVVFELDNDYFLGRSEETGEIISDLTDTSHFLREEIKELTGKYPVPVFKLHQGVEYWKALCEDENYPILAIGGLAQKRAWNTQTELIKTLMDYARMSGKKVHLLGCQNVQAFKTIQPDTVDYSIFQLAINLERAKKEHPEMNSNYTLLRHHIVLYALANSYVRSFLYDSYCKA